MIDWFRSRPKGNLQKFYASLPRVRINHSSYTRKDRYAEFRAVFFGHSTPEQGQRVLAQILDEANGLPDVEADVHDHAVLAFRAGKRFMGLRIIKWLNAEPPQE